MGGRVLVVDDEPGIRTVLRAYLEAAEFTVSEAETATDAVAQATNEAQPADLVLLDLGLPDADGLDALRRIRRTSEVPVILVTARAEEVDKLVGLNVGADDYITKPFSPREVVARVRTVLRRTRSGEPGELSGAVPNGVLELEGLTIDEYRHEISLHGQPVALSALEVRSAGGPGHRTRPGLLSRPAPGEGLGLRLLRGRARRRRPHPQPA